MNRIVVIALAIALTAPVAAFAADVSTTAAAATPTVPAAARHRYILAEQVKAGQLTQAQADHLRGEMKAVRAEHKAMLNTDTSTPIAPVGSVRK